ncbi:MAG: ABC transporter permease [Clostridiales bacterium]|jgi:hypothetical protein|nr:ABC transporter permease [Clostridiales bacterium]
MANIIKSDLYRFGKSKLLYGIIIFTGVIAFALIMLARQDIRVGISVFGNLTAFKGIDDVIQIGLSYQKGLGIFIAILLSIFIGQEYQWKTWQHKWITNKSRARIYLSKAMLSSAASASIFLIFEVVALLASNQIREILISGYVATVICGLFIYAALGALICMLSMLIKNDIASTVICLCYVLFSETLASVIGNVSSFSETVSRFMGWVIQHSIYGMSTAVSSTIASTNLVLSIIINSLVTMLLSTAIGLTAFRKYEL